MEVGTSTISATSGAVVGSTTLTVTAATLSFDCGDAGEPVGRGREDAAVHGDRNVQRQLDAEPDGQRDVGFGHASEATINAAAWPQR